LGGLLISRDATCVQIFCLLVSLSLPLSSSAFNVADQNPAHISTPCSRRGRRLLRTTVHSRVYSLGLLRFLLSVMSVRTRNCNTARPSDRLTRKAVSSRETTHASLTPRTEEARAIERRGQKSHCHCGTACHIAHTTRAPTVATSTQGLIRKHGRGFRSYQLTC
jgi:hypothetical protein